MENNNPNHTCNIPVVVNVWLRQDILLKQFEVIRNVRPNIIFFASDGGRNKDEHNQIIIIRKIAEKVDWNCIIYKIFEDNNLGMLPMLKRVLDFVFSKVDRCAYLEDDIIPSSSYFYFCSELLEKYKEDERIIMINGMNHLEVYDKPNADYFFSNEGSIWGIAFWKRTYLRYCDKEYENDSYIRARIIEQGRVVKKTKFAKKITTNSFSQSYISGSEFNLGFIQLTQNQLIIIPTKNLISNLGNDKLATHASEYRYIPKGIRRVFNMKTYEYGFPLKHPKYVIPDYYYSKQVRKIMANGYPIVYFYRKIESALRHLVYGDFRGLKKKIFKLIKSK